MPDKPLLLLCPAYPGDADASTVTTERKRTRASALTVNTTQQSTENKEVKPVGTTALSPVSPAAKTVRTDSNLANDHSTKVVETSDGKTKTMTMTSVKTAPGGKSTQVTTMSKTDGNEPGSFKSRYFHKNNFFLLYVSTCTLDLGPSVQSITLSLKLSYINLLHCKSYFR